MNAVDLLRNDLRNREWIDKHLEKLSRDCRGFYVAVYNGGELVVKSKTIPVLETTLKAMLISTEEVTVQYFPYEPVATII